MTFFRPKMIKNWTISKSTQPPTITLQFPGHQQRRHSIKTFFSVFITAFLSTTNSNQALQPSWHVLHFAHRHSHSQPSLSRPIRRIGARYFVRPTYRGSFKTFSPRNSHRPTKSHLHPPLSSFGHFKLQQSLSQPIQHLRARQVGFLSFTITHKTFPPWQPSPLSTDFSQVHFSSLCRQATKTCLPPISRPFHSSPSSHTSPASSPTMESPFPHPRSALTLTRNIQLYHFATLGLKRPKLHLETKMRPSPIIPPCQTWPTSSPTMESPFPHSRGSNTGGGLHQHIDFSTFCR